MLQITLDIIGIADAEEVEELLERDQSGFISEKRGIGRSRRYSHIGDVVQIIGELGTLASFAKTVWELMKLRHSRSKSEPTETVVRITASNGSCITVRSSDSRSVSDILKALQTLM